MAEKTKAKHPWRRCAPGFHWVRNHNICAGIRWLFQKQKLASYKLKRTASWIDTVIEYKGYCKDLEKKKPSAAKQILRLENLYSELLKAK